MAAKRRVLVAEEVREFADRVQVPEDVEIDWLSAAQDVPPGDYLGLLPLLTRRIDTDVIERLPDLKVVANYAVGYDNIDVAALRERGIAVSNTPDVLTEATADLTWALILAVTRRLNEAERLAREGEWAWHPTLLLGTQLGGLTLGLLGAGRIGQAVGRRAVPFGMQIAYWDRVAQAEFEAEVGARRCESLDDILGLSDIVSVHLQLSRETAGLLGPERIGRMKAGAFLVNTARGGIVDEEALCEALESGKLGGAGLDVYENEPEIRACLKRRPNVVLLPHVGSATDTTRFRMFELAWNNLIRGIAGEALLTPVG